MNDMDNFYPVRNGTVEYEIFLKEKIKGFWGYIASFKVGYIRHRSI